MKRRLMTTIALITSTLLWTQASAQDDGDDGLDRILQGLEWGINHTDVLAHYRQEHLAAYQAETAGLRDTMEIDRIRRSHDQQYERIAGSYEEFPDERTGYEVSVLGGEVAGRNNEAMLTVRTDNAMLYYIFGDDRLFRIVVAYNSAYLGGLDFETFLDQVERRYGPAASTEIDETATGIRYLARAHWADSNTRLRVENRSNIFGTFVMVFSEPNVEDLVVARRHRPTGVDNRVRVSDRVRSLSQDTGRSDRDDIADQIIGAPTVVELVVPEAEPMDIASPEEAEPVADAEAAAAEEEAAAEAERRRRDRERERAREREEEEEEVEEEGITIY